MTKEQYRGLLARLSENHDAVVSNVKSMVLAQKDNVEKILEENDKLPDGPETLKIRNRLNMLKDDLEYTLGYLD